MPAPDASSKSAERRPAAAVDPVWIPLPLDPESLSHYRRSLGFRDRAAALEALAQTLAGAGWPAASGAMIVCRSNPWPLLAVWGRFGAADAAALEAQARGLDPACRHLRYVRYKETAEAARELAARLVERFGSEAIRRARFAAVPRGGLVVLGILAVILDLEPERLDPPSEAGELLVVVDDCALSGFRSAQCLERYRNHRVVFAHLYSNPRLRSAIEEREPTVAACLAARDLEEVGDEELAGGWRRRWAGGEPYWAGRLPSLCFPWGEADRWVWNPRRRRAERAWRVVPPDLCLKNRPPAGTDPIPVQVQPEGRGELRPAGRVLSADLGGSVVLGDFASGASFVLEGVAADIWRQVVRVGDLPAVVADLARQYRVSGPTLRRDVEAFVARLTDQGLLHNFDPAPVAARAPAL